MDIPKEVRGQFMRINFPALFVLSGVVVFWAALSPVWWPIADWLGSVFLPAVWFIGGIVLATSGALLMAFGFVAVVMLLAGVIPKSL